MRKLWRYMIGIAMAVVVGGMAAGCSTNPPVRSSLELNKGSVLNIGDQAVFNLQGTGEVKNVVCLGETIPVYREVFIYQTMSRTEVGKVKVLNYVGENKFDAQVVEGQLKDGDIARKDSATCLLYRPDAG
ncbi:MAG: hypothetical protein VB050_08850 [Geobacteraceae bacterium]|nr:hypothetical protein [Geobacteraceae bacterium]